MVADAEAYVRTAKGLPVSDGTAYATQQERQQSWLAKDQELLEVLVASAQQLVQEATAEDRADYSRVRALQEAIVSCRACLAGVREAWEDLNQHNYDFDKYDVLYASLSDGLAEKHLMLYSEIFNLKGTSVEAEGSIGDKSDNKVPGLPMVGVSYRPSLSLAAAAAARSSGPRAPSWRPTAGGPEDSGCCPPPRQPAAIAAAFRDLCPAGGQESRLLRTDCTVTEFEVLQRSLPWSCTLEAPSCWGGAASECCTPGGGHQICRESRLLRRAATPLGLVAGIVEDARVNIVEDGAKCEAVYPSVRRPPASLFDALRCCQVTQESSIGI